MKTWWPLLLPLLLTAFPACEAKSCRLKPIRIAVIDTGFQRQRQGPGVRLCRSGHRDYSIEQIFTASGGIKVPFDTVGHGTNIIGIIDDWARLSGVNYCVVVIKYYSRGQDGIQNLNASIKAIEHAIEIDADVINYSGGGGSWSQEEYGDVRKFLNRGGIFVAAAGNEAQNLDYLDDSSPWLQKFYPAQYDDRVVVVGNLCRNRQRCPNSNYGRRVDRWETGEQVRALGITMSGTSQATAVATGKIIGERFNRCD